jgi:hypothetical protein
MFIPCACPDHHLTASLNLRQSFDLLISLAAAALIAQTLLPAYSYYSSGHLHHI